MAVVSIPQKDTPLCGFQLRNTEIIVVVVSIPQKDTPLCGASFQEVLRHKGPTGVKKKLLFDSALVNSSLHVNYSTRSIHQIQKNGQLPYVERS